MSEKGEEAGGEGVQQVEVVDRRSIGESEGGKQCWRKENWLDCNPQ